MTYPTNSQSIDLDYQFSQNGYQGNVNGYQNERQPQAHLYSNDAKGTNLGHKFWSFSWQPQTLGPNQYLIAFLNAPQMNVISGGWKISHPNDQVFAIESYDRQLDQWVITLYNASQNTKQVTFTLIAKERS
ncbi:hypothetical protein U2I54_16105 [Bacillus pseudomycoides]|uniref:Uncharacterized protein n=1 Tax=Bacillus bingmayongensis TaxID=1150157 RepID=A0ABU5JYP0_9BACI|nr:hypothetical protein [Bacillus pseudomycoides]